MSGAEKPGRSVRRADTSDIPEIVAVLGRAFDDDPVSMFLFDGDRHRRRGLRKFFSIQLRHSYMVGGEVWTTDDLAGASLWAPPDKARPGLMDLVRLLPVAPDLLGRNALRAVRLLVSIDQLRPKQAHWYLGVLGTDPDRQGQGVGSMLLASVLDRCDEQGLPAYLESSKERNVPFYARHGFEVTHELHSPGGGPTLWLMWREPKGPPA